MRVPENITDGLTDNRPHMDRLFSIQGRNRSLVNVGAEFGSPRRICLLEKLLDIRCKFRWRLDSRQPATEKMLTKTPNNAVDSVHRPLKDGNRFGGAVFPENEFALIQVYSDGIQRLNAIVVEIFGHLLPFIL
jgi:hypothetical protein